MMLEFHEHCGAKKKEKYKVLSMEHHAIIFQDSEESYSKFVDRKKGDKQLCYSIKQKENNVNNVYRVKSSYMIGLDWVIKNELSIYIQPKLNREIREVDYISMLFEALEEPENLNHLEGLLHVNFEAPMIEINQSQDKLTPFLLLEFLQVMKRIVRKGLKKSYYKVTENLNSRVKGKILVNATVKQNHTKQKMSHTVCQYQEFGYNSLENRILKKALVFVQSVVSSNQYSYSKKNSKTSFDSLISYISPAFQNVNEEVDIRKLKNTKPNPLFKEYTQAIKLAKIILKKYGYNISQTTKETYKTPPFWIDMAQLFELYTFKKLRDIFPGSSELKYHETVNRVEPDFILNSGDLKMVIDAKYKPHYKNNGISLDDARQVSGYARLVKMYQILDIDNQKEVIDCLIIYSDQETGFESFNSDLIKSNKFKKYVHFYKLGLKLPEVTIYSI